MGPEMGRGGGGGGNSGNFAFFELSDDKVLTPRILSRTTIESENPRDRQRFIISFIDIISGPCTFYQL